MPRASTSPSAPTQVLERQRRHRLARSRPRRATAARPRADRHSSTAMTAHPHQRRAPCVRGGSTRHARYRARPLWSPTSRSRRGRGPPESPRGPTDQRTAQRGTPSGSTVTPHLHQQPRDHRVARRNANHPALAQPLPPTVAGSRCHYRPPAYFAAVAGAAFKLRGRVRRRSVSTLEPRARCGDSAYAQSR